MKIQPLVYNYSFQGNKGRATDMVVASQQDAALQAITDKLNEVITAFNVVIRDDNTIRDGVIEARHLSPDALELVTSIANQAADAALSGTTP